MTDKRFTNSQSPRASRSSTNDPEKFSRGEVQLGMSDPTKRERDGINDHAWSLDEGSDHEYVSTGKYFKS